MQVELSDLDRFPRRPYSALPTALQHMPHLTRFLGGPDLYIKRDDMLGLLGGGNKTRKLEFVIADALAQGADSVITAGALQSNHCRLTLSAAALEGLHGHLVLWEPPGHTYRREANGNNFLYELLGVSSVTVVQNPDDMMSTMHAVADDLRAAGHRPYVIPVGAANGLGSLGYALAGLEIEGQAKALNVQFDAVVVASGACGTQAGLLAGLSEQVPVLGVSVSGEESVHVTAVRELIGEMEVLLGQELSAAKHRVWCTDKFVGPPYPEAGDAAMEAIELTARLEGILLDPTYTAKAMAALIALTQDGTFRPGQRVLFVHTGGVPGLFAHTDQFFSRWRNKEPHTD